MKKSLWIGIAALVVLVGFYIFRIRNGNNVDQPMYETVRVQRQDLEVKVLSTGTIQPHTRVAVTSPVNGRIDRIEVDEGEMVKEGDVLAWISSEERVALLDAARSELEEAQEHGDQEMLKEAKMAYEIAERAYKAVPLTNSISGEVINRSCEPGQNVSIQTVLFVISDRLVAGVEVDEADIGKIKPDQDARIVLDAFPDEQVQAKVTKISREGRIVSNVVVYDVMVEPENVPPYWSSGMTANVEFVTEAKSNVLTIPKSAVKEEEDRRFVLVLEENLKPRRVKVGISDGKTIEITEGLMEGETVVVGEIEKNAVPKSNLGGQMRMMRPPR